MNAIREAVRLAKTETALRNNDLQGYYNHLRFVVANFIYDLFTLVLAFVLIGGAL